MGLIGNDQTACLVAVAQNVTEDHSRSQHTRRPLTKKRKRTDKNDEQLKDSKTNFNQKL